MLGVCVCACMHAVHVLCVHKNNWMDFKAAGMSDK